jgi:hypothetical protein
MAARLRLARSGWIMPLTAVALLGAALAVPACDGSGGTSNTGGGGGSSGDCAVACSGDTPVCDPDTKECVGCLPSNDTCAAGQYCDPTTNGCLDGCQGDADCTSPQTCDPDSHQCVDCTDDSQCDAGSVCSAGGSCLAGCSDSQPCSNGLACCAGACTDLQNDPSACGACGTPCPNLDHAFETCAMGVCQLGTCEDGYSDCNQNSDDGCEWNDGFGACSCTPGATQECYSGPVGTKDVGTCAAGISTCDPTGTMWGPCEGQVVPIFDTCADGLDNDCDGTADNAKDLDGDGWTACEGDCCDVVQVDVCGDPGLVNPGAVEVPGNDVDDDCDGTKDNPPTTCDMGLASNSSTAGDYAKAIDLCATTTENPADPKDKKWGVISANLFRANGAGTPAANSRSIRPGFGSNITPLGGSRLVVLSTGHAADSNDVSPGFAAFQSDVGGGQDMGTTSPVPADWLAANGNNFPNAPGCPEPSGNTANDPVMLKVRVRVPTNAKSFGVSSFFFSAEYPEWTCSPYNDFFLTLLDSTFMPGAGQVGNPADKNLAFYSAANGNFPVGVNLAHNGTGLFNQCENGGTGCQPGCVAGNTNNTCTGTNLLTGTGFDVDGGNTYVCGNNDFVGGGTGWLTTNGNVKPGETIELRFVIWDTSDHIFDSLVLIDNFNWSLEASTPGTHE